MGIVSRIVRKMCGDAPVTNASRTVSLAEWQASGMPIYPEAGPRNLKDDGMGTNPRR